MTKRTGILMGLVAGVVIAGLVAATLYVSELDRKIIAAVEETGREALGTEVDLASVDVSLTDGSAALYGLRVENLEGFEAPYALTINTIALDFNLDSLARDVIEISEAVVAGGALYVEERGGTTNVGELLERLQDDEPAADAEPEQRIMIDLFTMTGAEVHVASEQLDGEGTLALAPVTAEDIGTATGGVTYAEASEALLGPVLSAARRAVRERAGEALSEAARQEIEEAARGELEELLGE